MLKWKRVQFFDSQCSVTSNNMKLVHWPLIGKLLHLVQRGGDWAGPQPTQSPPRCTKCNSRPLNDVQRPVYTNHRIAVWSPMLCGFNVPIKGLSLEHNRNGDAGAKCPRTYISTIFACNFTSWSSKQIFCLKRQTLAAVVDDFSLQMRMTSDISNSGWNRTVLKMYRPVCMAPFFCCASAEVLLPCHSSPSFHARLSPNACRKCGPAGHTEKWTALR